MKQGRFAIVGGGVVVAVLGAGIALAQGGPSETRSGTIEVVTNADGKVEYWLNDGTGRTRLSVGPHWFWGDSHPLSGLDGQQVTITGAPDDGAPAPAAADRARGDGAPSFDVYNVDGNEIRGEGKPPWAGGPKTVGPSHPGYEGWSHGQAAGEDERAEAAPGGGPPPWAGGPKVVGASHPGYEGWAKGQAKRAGP